MKFILSAALIICLLIPSKSFSWGKKGHRIVGQIAYNHMTKNARKNIKKHLGNESIAIASYWMDHIRADKNYDYQTPWHYCTIPDGKTYEEAGTPEEGDIIVTIQRLLKELKSKEFTNEGELHAIRMLIHLVGDLHQPLHVGNGTDRGGNTVKLKFMWRDTNLHRVWDSNLIDEQDLSFTEYVDYIDFPTEPEISKWQSTTVLDWANESKSYREQVYKVPEDNNLTFKYIFDNKDLVDQRLLQAGIRLAGIFNEIYD
jgi:hypothetical protein